jgi:hypothetical protein
MGDRVSFKGYSIVSCGVLHRELNYLRNIGFLDADKILYTAPGLHANRDELKSQLTKQCARAKKVLENMSLYLKLGWRKKKIQRPEESYLKANSL